MGVCMLTMCKYALCQRTAMTIHFTLYQRACTYYQCVFIETVQTHIVNVVNVPEYIVKVHILTMIHNELRTTATTGHKKKYHMIIHFYITLLTTLI